MCRAALTVSFEIRKMASFEHILTSLSALIILWTREIGRVEVPILTPADETAVLDCTRLLDVDASIFTECHAIEFSGEECHHFFRVTVFLGSVQISTPPFSRQVPVHDIATVVMHCTSLVYRTLR